MKQRPRIYYSESQKALMWERWRKGDSLQQIAQLFDRNHSSIQRILAETGGIQPTPRRRPRLALTLADGKRFHVGWSQVVRSEQSPPRSSVPLRASAGRSGATEDRETTGPIKRNKQPGSGHGAPSYVSWQRTGAWQSSWPASCKFTGRQSKLPDGYDMFILGLGTTKCHMRLFIAASTSKREAL